MLSIHRCAIAFRLFAFAMLGSLLAFPATDATAQPGAKRNSFGGRVSHELEKIRDMLPAQRLQYAEEQLGEDFGFIAAAKKDLMVEVRGRGVLEPAQQVDLACKAKARGKEGSPATTIKWLIDDGSFVKKGDKLAELDDSSLRDLIQEAKVKLLAAEAAKVQAEVDRQLAKRESEIEVRLAEIALDIAANELKKPVEGANKEILQLKVEAAKLKLERAKTQAMGRVARANAEEKAKTAALELEAKRLHELEDEARQCVLIAPSDGFVVYYAASSGRFGSGALIAVGEGIREGQKLLRLCDLSKMAVTTRVHESLISKVRKGQEANVRIDAYPDRVFLGKVSQIATVASAADFLNADVKVYPVTIEIDGDVRGLKPGMSADVQISLGEQKEVLVVPVTSVVSVGREQSVFVKSKDGLIERRVVTGASNTSSVEIKKGLVDGEEVLIDARRLLMPERKASK